MVKFIHPKPDHIFALTAYGLSKATVRSKFETESPTKKRYEKCVPINWVENGYVEEIRDGEKQFV